MGELETTTIIGIGGFAIGLVFGAVVQRTDFCTMGAISDLVLMGDGRRFRAWVLAIPSKAPNSTRPSATRGTVASRSS